MVHTGVGHETFTVTKLPTSGGTAVANAGQAGRWIVGSSAATSASSVVSGGGAAACTALVTAARMTAGSVKPWSTAAWLAGDRTMVAKMMAAPTRKIMDEKTSCNRCGAKLP